MEGGELKAGIGKCGARGVGAWSEEETGKGGPIAVTGKCEARVRLLGLEDETGINERGAWCAGVRLEGEDWGMKYGRFRAGFGKCWDIGESRLEDEGRRVEGRACKVGIDERKSGRVGLRIKGEGSGSG